MVMTLMAIAMVMFYDSSSPPLLLLFSWIVQQTLCVDQLTTDATWCWPILAFFRVQNEVHIPKCQSIVEWWVSVDHHFVSPWINCIHINVIELSPKGQQIKESRFICIFIEIWSLIPMIVKKMKIENRVWLGCEDAYQHKSRHFWVQYCTLYPHLITGYFCEANAKVWTGFVKPKSELGIFQL